MNIKQVFEKLWQDPKYLRLHARKDAALRAAILAEAYKDPEDRQAKANAAAKRAVRALGKYEDAALAAA